MVRIIRIHSSASYAKSVIIMQRLIESNNNLTITNEKKMQQINFTFNSIQSLMFHVINIF